MISVCNPLLNYFGTPRIAFWLTTSQEIMSTIIVFVARFPSKRRFVKEIVTYQILFCVVYKLFRSFLCRLCTTYVVKLDRNGYMVVALISKMVDLGDFDFVGNTLRESSLSL